MLIFPLKKEWYEKIQNGKKTIEYREVKDFWRKRLFSAMIKFAIKTYYVNDIYTAEPVKPIFCILQLGYTRNHLKARITKIEIVDGKGTDLHVDKPVYAIHLSDIQKLED